MLIEMLLLAIVAVAIFAWVLAPLVRPERPTTAVEETEDAPTTERREPVAPDGQPVRDTP